MRLSLFLLFFVHLPLASISQEYAVDIIPNELRSRASAIVRNEQIVLDMNNDNKVSETINRTVTILNKAGEDYAHLTLYYNKGKKIGKINGLVYNEFGHVIKKFSTRDFSDHSDFNQSSLYDDVRFKYYTPNINSYPYTISYSYEVDHSQNMFVRYWQPNVYTDVAVENSSYQVLCNPDLELRIKEENIPREATIETTAKSKSYTWTAQNLPARKAEPFSPIYRPDQITVKVAPKNFRFFKKNGRIEDWHDLGKWVYEVLLEDKQDLPETTIAQVRELVAHYTTDREKAQALYAYMQQKTRYISIQVGIGGIEPFPASYVDRLGYGDCKALVNYMQALLTAVDIDSHYCIVEASNAKIDLDRDFADIVDGNHIILCVPMEQDTVWLECTNNKAPFGHLGSFTDDRVVLACTPEGGKILHTPRYEPETSLQHRKGQLTVEDDGSLKGTIQTIFSGGQLENHFGLLSLSGTELDRGLKQAYEINNIFFDAIGYSTDFAGAEQKVIENLDIYIRNYVLHHDDQLILQPNVFNRSSVIPNSKNRINDVYINRGFTDIDDIEFSLSTAIQGEVKPVEQKLSCPMGNYELRVSTDGDKVYFYRKLEIKDGTYAAGDYEAYFNFMREVAAHDNGKYQLPLGK